MDTHENEIRDDAALVLGEILIEAGRGYLDWWDAFSVRPSPEEDSACAEAIRESGRELTELLLYADLLLELADDLEQPVPEAAAQCFRTLTHAYALLAGVKSYEHLVSLPLPSPDDVADALNEPATVAWLRATGAAL